MMRGRGDTRFFWALTAIVVLGALVRVAYAFSQKQHLPLGGDSLTYTVGAEFLANGRGWIDPYIVSQPTANHPPLYMLWLWVPAFFADGHHVSQFTSMLWSCIPGTATVALCGLAGREIAGRRYGLVAAALAAVYPGLWVNDGTLLAETMAAFTAAGLILLAYRYWNHPTPARVAWLGAGCGIATLARSEMVLSFVFVLLPLVLLTKRRPWTVRVGWLAMAAAIGVAVVSPWLIFNAGRFHERVLISTNAGRTMAAANCDTTYYGPRIGFKSYECLGEASTELYDPSYDESDRDKVLRATATQYMKDHATRVPIVMAARLGRVLQVYQPRQEIQLNGYYHTQGRFATELQFWSFYLVAGLAIVGAFLLRHRRVAVFPLLAFPAICLVTVAWTFAQWRYRAVAEPALVLLASVPLAAGLRRVARRRADVTVTSPPVTAATVSRT